MFAKDVFWPCNNFQIDTGRFDFHVELPAPGAAERGALLKHEIQRRSLQCSDDVLLDIASKCDGYDAYDLVINLHNIKTSKCYLVDYIEVKNHFWIQT